MKHAVTPTAQPLRYTVAGRQFESIIEALAYTRATLQASPESITLWLEDTLTGATYRHDADSAVKEIA